MSEISTAQFSVEALMRSIGAMAFESEMLLLRIEAVDAETDDEEGLSDTVMRLDAALSELRPAYDAQRQGAAIYPMFDELVERHRALARRMR
jgi:hypothetical protein